MLMAPSIEQGSSTTILVVYALCKLQLQPMFWRWQTARMMGSNRAGSRMGSMGSAKPEASPDNSAEFDGVPEAAASLMRG